MSTIKISDSRLEKFYDLNPDFDILKFNLLNGKTNELKWEDNGKRETTLDLLKKYQRLLRINPNPKIAKKLLNATEQATQPSSDSMVAPQLSIKGVTPIAMQAQPQEAKAPVQLNCDSAHAIASMTEEQFVKILPEDEAEARQMHKKAIDIQAKTQLLWANMKDAVASSHFRSMRVSTTDESDHSALSQNIPSYQEMFGDLDYLDCEHCGSIFGAAAYFVDLMRIVDQYITEPNQNTIPEGLTLNKRRPDLEEIKLTCENTNTLVPSLQIINCILEARVGLQSLATEKYPFNLPFNFPLEQIRSYLGHLKTDLASIYQTFYVDELAIAREYIGLSLEEYDFITNSKTDQKELKKFYGIEDLEGPSKVETFLSNVETFLKQTGLSRTELAELLEQNLHKSELDNRLNFYINKFLDNNKAVQFKQITTEEANAGEIPTIENLTPAILYRIHRFIRLAKKLNWSFTDLDWVLTSIKANKIDAEAIKKIAKIKKIQAQYKLPLDVLCSFWHEIKTIGIGSNPEKPQDLPEKPQDLFNRVFNNPFKEILGDKFFFALPHENKQIKLNDLERETETNPNVLRISAALRLSTNELIDILRAIWGKKNQENTVKLTLENLSQLFRTSQILRLLGLNIEEYQVLLSFLHIDIKSISSLSIDQFIQITELAEWVKSSQIKIDELDYIITGKLTSNLDIRYSKTDITARIQSLQQLAVDSLIKFSDFIGEDIDKQKSLTIFDKLLENNYIEEFTSNYEKVMEIKPDQKIAIVLNSEINKNAEFKQKIINILKDENQLDGNQLEQQVLHLQKIIQNAYDRQKKVINEIAAIFANEIASSFAIEADLAVSLLDFASIAVTDTPNYIRFLLTCVKPEQFLSRILLLTQKLELTPTELKCIADNKTAFGIENLSKLSINNIQTIHRFKGLIVAFGDDQNKLVEYFASVSKNGENNHIEELAKITGWKSEQIYLLVSLLVSSLEKQENNQLNLDSNLHKTVEGINKLKQCFDLSHQLGVNISWFTNLRNLEKLPLAGEQEINGKTIKNLELNWEVYQNASQAVRKITKTKYDDEQWVKVSEKLEGGLNKRKRDVLTACLLGKNNYENLRHLSQELLIDVETSSEVSISKIKEAILAIQTYLHRCRMGLEPGVNQLNIPENWWQWMMNYRVWEANRKVFLYPENYLDPSLRKIKSPIYKELEDELLQSEITQESVEKAYENYFEKFAEIAQLKPAGGYRCTVEKNSGAQDTLYLFGRTATEPYTYYYRECINPEVEKPIWKAWQKIDLTINSEYINATYAFNKLLIFWVEVVPPEGKSKTETKATIKYSFHKFGKQWIQPQTLAKDIVINQDNFEKNKKLWTKVTAFFIPSNNSEPGQILILYGNLIKFDRYYHTTSKFQGTILTIDLRQENLLVELPDHEFKVTRSLISKDSKLKIKKINNIFYDNHDNDFTDLNNNITLTEPENLLTANMSFSHASIKTIENQPNWFTFDNGDEAFLVIPNKQLNINNQNTLEFGTLETRLKPEDSPIKTLSGHTGLVNSVNFSPNGSLLASGGDDGHKNNQIIIWDIEKGDEYFRLEDNILSEGSRVVYDVNFSPDGTLLASGAADGKIKIWNLKTGQVIRTLEGHTGIANSVNFSPDGALLGYGATDRKIKIWNLKTGQVIHTLEGHTGLVNSVNFSPDSALLASGCNSNEIKIWNVETGQLIHTLEGFTLHVVRSVNFNHDGSLLAAIGRGREIKIWNVETGQVIRTLEGDTKQVNSINFSPDGALLASVGIDKKIKIWNIAQTIKLDYKPSKFEELSSSKFTFTRLTTTTIRQLSKKMFIGGLDSLLTVDSQLTPELDFNRFSPTEFVIPPNSRQLDFDGPLGIYFQEIFFHIPFLVANTLNSNQRFQEAQKWYHYIFNPTIQDDQKDDQKGLVGYWSMNNESGEKVIYDLGSKNHGILKGNAKLEKVEDFPGTNSRNVLTLDGNSSYVNLNEKSNLRFDGNKPYTMAAWIKPKGAGIIISKFNQGHHGAYFVKISESGDVIAQRESAGELSSNKVVPLSEWSHIAITYNESILKIYIDGNLANSQALGSIPNDNQTRVLIGAFYRDGKTTEYFEGQIAEVRIWNYARSPKQIFDDVSRHSSDRFWHYLPFRGNTLQKLQDILTNDAAIDAYNDNPFDPHAIAQLRIGAYEKALVMKYIDNLLDWGDQLFAQDNRESISQATILYLLAYDLLGKEPENLGKRQSPSAKTFKEIKEQYENHKDDIPQFLIELENHVNHTTPRAITSAPFNDLNTYFCAPENEQFIAYWERVEDRLYKIRHSLSIEGIRRELALFQPPIDPAELVRAVAGGRTPLSVVSQLNSAVPNYRFDYMLERAKNITSTLIQLGSSLLSALEKKDAEELALLRSSHEQSILKLVTTTKEKQIEEAEANLESLKKSLASAGDRQAHYQKLLGGLFGVNVNELIDVPFVNVPGLNLAELGSIALMGRALTFQGIATLTRLQAAPLHLLPTIVGTSNGGMKFGDAAQAIASALDSVAGTLNQTSSMVSTIAQFQRRQEDWELQEKMANWDVQQIEEQIKAAQVRIEMAKAELDVHNKSMEHSREVEEFLQGKFTNQELYQWMIGRLSILYFQTYKIALDMAMATQSAYQYELNKDDTYINFDYWDSLKKGLVAGESLMLGLNQLEKAYIEGNVRRLEIEKTISLLQINCQEFQKLKNTGKCEFELNEKLFDFDFPGHYCRQIKTIAISIPAVVGPYQNINATLTQTKNETLLKPNVSAVNYLLTREEKQPDDSGLRSNWRRNQKIALSKGTNDTGLFELNFRDERYLPFEGTGAVSKWELSLPKATNPIDFDSISDVIITLSYTALDGGDKFREKVTNLEPLKQYSQAYYFNLKQAFPEEWHAFMNSNTDKNSQKFHFNISEEIIPPHIKDAKLTGIIFKLDTPDISSPMSFDTITIGGNNIINENDNSINQSVANNWFGDWVINFDLTKKVPDGLKKEGFLNPEKIKNIELILIYEGTVSWAN
ncbi:MAG: neuraminidase-like domain-containing protein [Cyanobacteria bacterium J06635_10]